MSGHVVAFDTSTEVCAVALLRVERLDTSSTDGVEEGPVHVGVVQAETLEVGRSHTRVLLQSLDRLLAGAGVGPGDLGAVVVGTGPGTFTGVRIAVAAARALALSWRLPVLGVPTLAALAALAGEVLETGASDGGTSDVDALVPVVDARRRQVFAGLYKRRTRTGGAPLWVRTAEYAPVEPGRLRQHVEEWGAESPLLVGDPRLLSEAPYPALPMLVDAAGLLRGQSLLSEPGVLPQGSRLLPWLGPRLLSCGAPADGDVGVPAPQVVEEGPGEVGSPESVRPLYVRTPDADYHITRMKDPWSR